MHTYTYIINLQAPPLPPTCFCIIRFYHMWDSGQFAMSSIWRALCTSFSAVCYALFVSPPNFYHPACPPRGPYGQPPPHIRKMFVAHLDCAPRPAPHTCPLMLSHDDMHAPDTYLAMRQLWVTDAYNTDSHHCLIFILDHRDGRRQGSALLAHIRTYDRVCLL